MLIARYQNIMLLYIMSMHHDYVNLCNPFYTLVYVIMLHDTLEYQNCIIVLHSTYVP